MTLLPPPARQRLPAGELAVLIPEDYYLRKLNRVLDLSFVHEAVRFTLRSSSSLLLLRRTGTGTVRTPARRLAMAGGTGTLDRSGGGDSPPCGAGDHGDLLHSGLGILPVRRMTDG